jgi:hypothetical protein
MAAAESATQPGGEQGASAIMPAGKEPPLLKPQVSNKPPIIPARFTKFGSQPLVTGISTAPIGFGTPIQQSRPGIDPAAPRRSLLD